MIYKATLLIVAASVLSLGGCSLYKPMPEPGTQEYRDTLAVVMQVCMPRTYTSVHLWVSEVKRYGSYGEMRSYGGGAVGVRKVGMTPTGHPIFEKFFRKRQIDLIDIMVNVNETQYVYNPEQKKLSIEEWTTWDPPVSQNPRRDMVGYQLANHRDLKIRQPDVQAPKIRYRLVRMSDWAAPRSNDTLLDCESDKIAQ